MKNFDKQKYDQEWFKKNRTRFNVSFSNEKDKDVIEHLRKQKNRLDFLRRVIRKDIEESKD